jgi:exonuclease SbcC
MRPLRLEVEGFTSFAEPTELDFSSLDLFAITGPTGAGKSSLIDAMIFALYGWVPRVGNQYRQLVSHGAERLAVQLDFGVGKERYRVARNARKSDGRIQARLDRVDGDVTESIAGGVREIDQAIVRIIGLDHDAFTRSVVLPQGQFDLFLKGKPEERRKILVALLNLGVYEEMQKIANRRGTTARTEAGFISNQLDTDYADATIANLSEKKKELKGAEKEQKTLEEALAVVEKGLEAARAVRAARRELETICKDIDSLKNRIQSAEKDAKTAADSQKQIDSQLKALDNQRKDIGFDEKRYLALLSSIPRLEAFLGLAPRVSELQTKLTRARKDLEKQEAELGKLEKEKPKAEALTKDAKAAVSKAESVLADLQRKHAAAAIRETLTPGEACPVCERPIEKLPKGRVPALAHAEKDLQEARQKAETARERAESLKHEIGSLKSRVETSTKGVEDLSNELKEEGKNVDQGKKGLLKLGFAEKDLSEGEPLLTRLQSEQQKLEAARTKQEKLNADVEALKKGRAETEKQISAARGRIEEAQKSIADLEKRRAKSEKTYQHEHENLEALAERHGWQEALEVTEDRDEANILEDLARSVRAEQKEINSSVTQLKTEIRVLAEKIERAARLQEKKKSLEAEAALANELAQSLKANQFLAYIQEEALRVLAEDGSRHLDTLSQGRYSLTCDEQDFSVVDHWNADEVRSVKTLSGGESFLASLALALALAERLSDFSAAGNSNYRLESLFLDEGFGTLDSETLDVVVQGIEALHGGQRMVGIVTHIQELAERMPVRVEVVKQHGRATLAVI